jgi:glycosyltransferase involved in cell wall biosynthesis
MRLLIVIPAFNEEEALPALLDECRAACADLPCASDVVVVDDGSSDRTAIAAEAKGVRVLRLCRNLGIGGAVQAGLRLAYREGFDFAVQIDGDGQHPPREIRRLLARANGVESPDLVVGSRRLELRGYQASGARLLGQVWLRLWLLAICRLQITDPTSGFRLYGRQALGLFQQTYPYDFPEPEALAIACAQRLRVVEEPVEMRARQGGRSSIAGLDSLYYMVKVTLAVALAFVRNRRRRPRRPLRPQERLVGTQSR